MIARPVLVIGNKNYSSWSLRPWLLMRYFGVEFDEHMIWLDEPEMRDHLQPYASNYTVPVLVDGEIQVWDSLAILEYVGDKFALVDAWPLDISARGLARSISAEMHSGFPHLRGTMPMNIRKVFEGFMPTAVAQADVDRVQHLWRRCREEYGQANDEKVADPGWLFGHFSAADAMYAPVVLRFRSYGVSGCEIVKAYCDKVWMNPHIQNWAAAARLERQIVEADEI